MNNRRLIASNGNAISYTGYKIIKIKVTQYEKIKVVSDDYFQFQATSSVPMNGQDFRIGGTYSRGVYYLEVPSSATYLIASTPSVSSTEVYKLSNIDIWPIPDGIRLNLPSSIIHIRDFVHGQRYDYYSGKIIPPADGYTMRSKGFYKAKGGVGYISNVGQAHVTKPWIHGYDKDFNFVDTVGASGTFELPNSVEYITVSAYDETEEEFYLYEWDKNSITSRDITLDLGGILTGGNNAAKWSKDPYTYKRTTSFIRIKKGFPFLLEFEGNIKVFEYSSSLSFIKSSGATSGEYYFPDNSSEYIKLESYIEQTLVSTPSITVGNKYPEDGETIFDPTATNRCYTSDISVSINKKYLIKRKNSEMYLSIVFMRADGSALLITGLRDVDFTLDFLKYLEYGEKIYIRGALNSGNFTSSDKPFEIYELTNNTNTNVKISYPQIAGPKTSKNLRISAREHYLCYKVHPLFGGEEPEGLCYTTGLLKLPPNYNANGKPVPVIFFAHGSDDYQSIDSFSLSSAYSDYIQYLADEGYAVFDAYGWTNLLAFAGGGQWGGPVVMSSIREGLSFIGQHYNLDMSKVFAMGKSLGGTPCCNMAVRPGIRAVACLAPELDYLSGTLGYSYLQRKASFIEHGFTLGNNDENVNFPLNTILKNAPEAFKQIIRENGDAFYGYNPILNNLISIDFDEIIETEISSGAKGVANIVSNKSRIVLAPVKIWVAPDDPTFYAESVAFVKSVHNAGGLAELRSMPSGTGGHHAVDNDPNALKVESIITDLGINHTNVPLAYVELVHWFRQNS